MKAKEMINACVDKRDMSKAALARKIGLTAQSLNDRINRGKSMNVDSLAEILGALGYEIVVRDRISGAEIGVLE